jgi:hypothetical protein
MFVPQGWWHCVLNLDDFGVAITQNFVSLCNLHAVLRVLHSRNVDLISGCPEEVRPRLYDMFTAALKLKHPCALVEWECRKADGRENGHKGKALTKLFCESGPVECSVDEDVQTRGMSSHGVRWHGSNRMDHDTKERREPEDRGYQFSFNFRMNP